MKVKSIILTDDSLDVILDEIDWFSGEIIITKDDLRNALAQRNIKTRSNKFCQKFESVEYFSEAMKFWQDSPKNSFKESFYIKEMIRLAENKNELATTVELAFDAKWDKSDFILAVRKFVKFLFPKKFSN